MRFVIVTGVSGAGKCEVFLCRQSADPFTGEICITDA